MSIFANVANAGRKQSMPPVAPREGFSYYLKNRSTGEEIDIGQAAELKTEVAAEHQRTAQFSEEEISGV